MNLVTFLTLVGHSPMQSWLKGCKHIIAPSWEQSFTSLLNAAVLLQHYPAKYLQHQPCKTFAALTLNKNVCNNVCNIHPAKCLQHPHCKMFAACILQNVCSINPAKCLQYPPCKMFAASTLQNVCSIHTAKCLKHPPYKMFAWIGGCNSPPRSYKFQDPKKYILN